APDQPLAQLRFSASADRYQHFPGNVARPIVSFRKASRPIKVRRNRKLLSSTGHAMFISDFALDSIGLLLVRQGKESVLRQFVLDMILNAGVELLSLPAEKYGSRA